MSNNGRSDLFGQPDNSGHFEGEPRVSEPRPTEVQQRRERRGDLLFAGGMATAFAAATAGLIAVALSNNEWEEKERRDGKVLEKIVGQDGFTYEYNHNDTIYDDSATIVIGMNGQAEGSECRVKVEAKVARDANGTIIDSKDYTLSGHAYPQAVTEHQGGLPPRVTEKVVGPEIGWTVQNLDQLRELTQEVNPCVALLGHSSVSGVYDN